MDLVTEEVQLISAFFLPTKRDRYIGFVNSPKQRHKFIAEMSHFKGLDPRYIRSIPSSLQTVEGIVELLMEMGASTTCLALSHYKEIDGKRLALDEALGTVLGRTYGTFLSCTPGALAFFENEDGRWILSRI
jgi:hypothetical protein